MAMPLAQALSVVVVCATPLAFHLGMTGEHFQLAASAALVIAAMCVFAGVRKPLLRWPIAAALLVAAAAAYAGRQAAAELALLLPASVYALVAWLFARTLAAGRVPLIQRIAEIERGAALPPELARHARGVTWAWALLFIGMAITSLLLALYASQAAWSLFSNVLSYALIGALFIGEYVYRVWRYPQFPHHDPVRVAFNLIRRGPELFRERS